jgi:hypothetical protein
MSTKNQDQTKLAKKRVRRRINPRTGSPCDPVTGQFLPKSAGKTVGNTPPNNHGKTVADFIREMHSNKRAAKSYLEHFYAGDPTAMQVVQQAINEQSGDASKYDISRLTEDESRVWVALGHKMAGDPPIYEDWLAWIAQRNAPVEEDDEEEQEEPAPALEENRTPYLLTSDGQPEPPPLRFRPGTAILIQDEDEDEPEPAPPVGGPILSMGPRSPLRMENEGTGIFGGYSDPRERNYSMKYFNTPAKKKRTN